MKETHIPGEGESSDRKQESLKQGSIKRESILPASYSFLASSRLGLFLLLVIGCVSLLGMFILQNAPREEYVSRYGEFWGSFIQAVGLGNVYSVWWYLLLILLISVNLVLCSLRRIKPSFSQAFSRPKAQDHEMLGDAPSINIPDGSVTVWKRVETSLRNKGFVTDSADAGSIKLIAAQKGSISRIGFIVTHVAVLLVLIAGIINGKFAYRNEQPLSIGETLDVSKIEPSANFSIRVDDFVIETTEEGRARAYKSTLTVIENGRAVLTKVIGVNHPLMYKGIGFYQASYGEEPYRIKEARIYFIENGSVSAAIDVPFQETRDVPDTDLQIKVADYVPHFVKDLVTGEVRSRSLEPKLPAIRLEIMRQGKIVDSGWLIRGMEAHSTKSELARFHFADYYPQLYTGIDIAKNPGTSLMFTGFAIASIGLSLSFFVSFRRIWVRVSEECPGHSEVRIAGVSSRQPLALKREIDGLYEILGTQSRWGPD
jgi:cytochrome c biogenesis protein